MKVLVTYAKPVKAFVRLTKKEAVNLLALCEIAGSDLRIEDRQDIETSFAALQDMKEEHDISADIERARRGWQEAFDGNHRLKELKAQFELRKRGFSLA